MTTSVLRLSARQCTTESATASAQKRSRPWAAKCRPAGLAAARLIGREDPLAASSNRLMHWWGTPLGIAPCWPTMNWMRKTLVAVRVTARFQPNRPVCPGQRPEPAGCLPFHSLSGNQSQVHFHHGQLNQLCVVFFLLSLDDEVQTKEMQRRTTFSLWRHLNCRQRSWLDPLRWFPQRLSKKSDASTATKTCQQFWKEISGLPLPMPCLKLPLQDRCQP